MLDMFLHVLDVFLHVLDAFYTHWTRFTRVGRVLHALDMFLHVLDLFYTHWTCFTHWVQGKIVFSQLLNSYFEHYLK